MLEQGTGCPPTNQDFSRNDDEGAGTELYNVRQNKYASVRYAFLSPTKEGQLGITVNSVFYSLDRNILRDLPCFCNMVNCSHGGVAPDARCAIHPDGRGVVIMVPGDTCLVPRDRFENVTLAGSTGLIVYPCEVS
jgi:hypothetical protein